MNRLDRVLNACRLTSLGKQLLAKSGWHARDCIGYTVNSSKAYRRPAWNVMFIRQPAFLSYKKTEAKFQVTSKLVCGGEE